MTTHKPDKKILILTLGTGNKYNRRENKSYSAQEAFASAEQVYRKANYIMPGSSEPVSSNFIAEPLIRSDAWDEVIILGTVKSAWSGLYLYFAPSKCKEQSTYPSAFAELYEKEEALGLSASTKEMTEFQDRINEIFTRDGTFKDIAPRAQIHCILTYYGVNSEQLKKNYSILRTIQNFFDKDRNNTVSFDITHSFRSLPLYNLVILSYFQNVSRYSVRIEHVYYGNLEASREYGEMFARKKYGSLEKAREANDLTSIANIVDLSDLIHVLELSHGAAEFKNTGSANTILRGGEDNPFQKKLRDFEWATQINNLALIKKSVREMCSVADEKGESSEQYDDLTAMIRDIIEQRMHTEPVVFFAESGQQEGEAALLHYADQQYAIALWYYRQRRYGETLTTAKECLRSYLAIPVLREAQEKETKNAQKEGRQANRRLTIDNLREENTRKQGESWLQRTKLYVTSADGMTGRLLSELADLSKKIAPIRDLFAHNLSNADISEDESLPVINAYMDHLAAFHQQMQNEEERNRAFEILARKGGGSGRQSATKQTYDLLLFPWPSLPDTDPAWRTKMEQETWLQKVRKMISKSRNLQNEQKRAEKVFLIPFQAIRTLHSVKDKQESDLFLAAEAAAAFLAAQELMFDQDVRILFWNVPDNVRLLMTWCLTQKGFDNIAWDYKGSGFQSPHDKSRFLYQLQIDEDELARNTVKREKAKLEYWLQKEELLTI